MLNLTSGVRVTCFSPKPLHPSVADTVQKYDKTLDELYGGNVLPMSNRDPVPSPTEFGKGAQEASKGDESITPEDATLDEMCEANVDVVSPASTRINDETGKQLHETSEDQDPFQRGENGGTGLLVPGFPFVHLGNDIL